MGIIRIVAVPLTAILKILIVYIFAKVSQINKRVDLCIIVKIC